MNRQFILYPVIVLLILGSSCATILNSPVQKIYLSSDKNIKVISVDNVALIDSSLSDLDGSIGYYVPRGKKSLSIQIQRDSAKTLVWLAPRNSVAYWYNIFSNYGIGMLVDRDNFKRYGYPARNYISGDDESLKFQRFAPVRKGTINLTLAIPFTTMVRITTNEKQYKAGGIFGIEPGLEYFYRDNGYLSFSVGGGMAGMGRFAEHLGNGHIESGSAVYTSLRNNRIIGSVDLGYGINLSQLSWNYQTFGDTISVNNSIVTNAAGLSFSGAYRIGKYFRLGVLYQPSFINISHPAFNYQHYISLNLIWKLPVKKCRQKADYTSY